MEALKSLLESEAITEQMAAEIQEAFDSKVNENRVAVTAELREEFAKKNTSTIKVLWLKPLTH